MSFNGSGTFNINTSGQPVVTGTPIDSSDFNDLTADLATGLSNCITKDGQTATTATIPIGSLSVDTIVNGTGLAFGTYAPTITGVANIGSVSASGTFRYSRIGSIVFVSGQLNIDTTAAASTYTEVGISLPIASNFAATTDASGTATTGLIESGSVFADETNNRAALIFFSGDSTLLGWTVLFQYEVL